MYHREAIRRVTEFIYSKNGLTDKTSLSLQVQQAFHLARERSVFYNDRFAIRFCSASSPQFSNTVLSLSALRKYDALPFLVCLVTPAQNYLLLANTTFLRKISHSSQTLRIDNIKGSFNGSDILREFEGLANKPDNFELLFASHEAYTFDDNLARLVAATNTISPTGKRFLPSEAQVNCIQRSVERAASFLASPEYALLNQDLNARVHAVAAEIALAAAIDNVNLRGRSIEYLITAKDALKAPLIQCLQEKSPLPELFTADDLGDYRREFDRYLTKTDIKTKVLSLSGNPKGYNIDKLLAFLAEEKSVYLVYIVAIDAHNSLRTCLCSVFNTQLLSGTRRIKHWAGRNSRGVTQYDGKTLEEIVTHFDASIDRQAAHDFLAACLAEGA